MTIEPHEPERKECRLQIMFEPSLIGQIDDYRFSHRIGGRAAAIRALIKSGLEAANGNLQPQQKEAA